MLEEQLEPRQTNHSALPMPNPLLEGKNFFSGKGYLMQLTVTTPPTHTKKFFLDITSFNNF
jgi:hypothetical protein